MEAPTDMILLFGKIGEEGLDDPGLDLGPTREDDGSWFPLESWCSRLGCTVTLLREGKPVLCPGFNNGFPFSPQVAGSATLKGASVGLTFAFTASHFSSTFSNANAQADNELSLVVGPSRLVWVIVNNRMSP